MALLSPGVPPTGPRMGGPGARLEAERAAGTPGDRAAPTVLVGWAWFLGLLAY